MHQCPELSIGLMLLGIVEDMQALDTLKSVASMHCPVPLLL